VARLFIGVWPPPVVVDTLTALRVGEHPGVRFVPRQNIHITMRFFGEADPEEVIAALDGAIFPSARAVVLPELRVLSGGAVALLVDGLDQLAAVVIDRTGDVGRPPGPSFRGHLTIARLRRGTRRAPSLPVMPQLQFDVGDVALIRSTLGADRARYETVRRWPVGGTHLSKRP
jgi:2'-5' RNA ligase